MVAATALAISLASLLISFDIWTRSFRPIVTAAVRTHEAGNIAIAYDLVLLNSGTIPARNIRITATEEALGPTFGKGASVEDKQRWLAGFNSVIPILHNNAQTSCSFGTTQADDAGFWKYDATIPIVIRYESWLGGWLSSWFGNRFKHFEENQIIQIADSNSFTGGSWG